MQSRDDVDDLYKAFGGDPGEYQEIGQEQKIVAARTRWPILNGERPGANVQIAPAVHVADNDAATQAPVSQSLRPASLVAPAFAVSGAVLRRGSALSNGTGVGRSVDPGILSPASALANSIEKATATLSGNVEIEREVETPDTLMPEHEVSFSRVDPFLQAEQVVHVEQVVQVEQVVPLIIEIEPIPELVQEVIVSPAPVSPVVSVSEPVARVVMPSIEPQTTESPAVAVDSAVPEAIAMVPAAPPISTTAAPPLKGLFARLSGAPVSKKEPSGGSTSS